LVGGGASTDTGARSNPVTPSDYPKSQPRIALGVVVAPGLARDVRKAAYSYTPDTDEMLEASRSDSSI
jgi:hypothetical protein